MVLELPAYSGIPAALCRITVVADADVHGDTNVTGVDFFSVIVTRCNNDDVIL